MMFGCEKVESILISIIYQKLILGETKIFYFMSESLLEKQSNINYFTLKLILTKSILTKLILSRINSTKAEPNMH